MAGERRHVVEHAVELPLSPELVLVSPDLREVALATERSFESHSYVSALPVPRPRAQLSVAPPPEPPTRALSYVPSAREPEPPAPARAEGGWRLTVGSAASIGLITAAVLFGAGVAVGKLALPASTVQPLASTFSPTTADRGRPAASRPVARPPLRATRTEAREVDRPQTTKRVAPVRRPSVLAHEPAKATASTAPVRRKAPAPQELRLIPNGSFVLPKGHFRLSSRAQTILDFTLVESCAGQLMLPPIRVGSSGTFAFAGHPAGSPPGTTVRVRGRFASPSEVRGTTQVTRTRCRTPATAFVARLS